MIPNHLEKIIFHNILENKEYIRVTKAEFFDSPNYSDLFKCAAGFIEKYNQTPTKEQMVELAKIGGLEKINRDFIEIVFNCDKSAYDKEWLQESTEAWIESKKLEKAANQLVTYLKTTDISIENVKNVVETSRDIIMNGTNLDLKFDEGLDFFNPESHRQPLADTFSSGFPYVDLVLGGGWYSKALFVLCGQQKVGKCSKGTTKITIRNKKTGEIKKISLKKFHELTKKLNPTFCRPTFQNNLE